MPNVVIYTKISCPYCLSAKELLNRKGVRFEEIDVTGKPRDQDAMSLKANGQRTVPQIFIHGVPIGGCDDLHALESEGKLDRLLAG